MLTVTEALLKLGFELRQDPVVPGLERGFSVLRGAAPAEPHFEFGAAWRVSRVLWVGDVRRTGEFLLCCDPGTGNVVQWFNLNSEERG
jgi:hypothetical protein